MRTRLTIDIDDEMAAALDRMIADMDPELSREFCAAEVVRDLADRRRLPAADEIEEDTPTEGEA